MNCFKSVKYVEEKKQIPSLLFSCRFLLACLIFIGVGVQYMQKIDMSIGIVCMVNNTALNTEKETNVSKPVFLINNQTSYDICKFKPKNETSKSDGPFVWSNSVQGFILSSYFYGYILTQVPSGWLSLRFGGKKVLGYSMLIGSLFTILASPSARLGSFALITCRFFTGIAHGAVWPAVSSMYIHWVPASEKSRIIGFAGSGAFIGNVVALPVASYLCIHGFDGGWPSIFYIFGIIGIVWFILFITLTSDSPNTHRFISKSEKDYITDATKSDVMSLQKVPDSITIKNDSIKIKESEKIPWNLVFKSKPCIAIFIAHFSSGWGNYLFLTQLPSFMNDILRFDIKSNGLFSTLPYITSWICVVSSGYLSDILIQKNVLSRKIVRKLFGSLGLIIPMIATICLSFVTCENPYLALVLLIIGVGFLGFLTGAGYYVNINEVGGKYSGILYGISNTFATLGGIIAPYIVSVITKNKLQEEWQIVFLLTSAIYFLGGLTYLIFSDVKIEDWAQEKKETNINE